MTTEELRALPNWNYGPPAGPDGRYACEICWWRDGPRLEVVVVHKIGSHLYVVAEKESPLETYDGGIVRHAVIHPTHADELKGLGIQARAIMARYGLEMPADADVSSLVCGAWAALSEKPCPDCPGPGYLCATCNGTGKTKA